MKASLAILLVALIASASAAKFTEEQYNFLFARFTSMVCCCFCALLSSSSRCVYQYGKNYKSSEMLHRYGLFKNNLDYIATENEKGHAYTLAVNEVRLSSACPSSLLLISLLFPRNSTPT